MTNCIHQCVSSVYIYNIHESLNIVLYKEFLAERQEILLSQTYRERELAMKSFLNPPCLFRPRNTDEPARKTTQLVSPHRITRNAFATARCQIDSREADGNRRDSLPYTIQAVNR
jgi:hypothetical protein